MNKLYKVFISVRSSVRRSCISTCMKQNAVCLLRGNGCCFVHYISCKCLFL